MHGNPNASGDDMLEINAGGKVIVAKRSTLTQHMVGTKFGALFSGRWEKKLQRDGDGRIFLDVNPECFQARNANAIKDRNNISAEEKD